MIELDSFVNALKSIAEPTRLRILNILLNQEMTVSEITDILNYSQPRISRHLKLMCDAGILDRVQEGSWVFYRIRASQTEGNLVRAIAGLMPVNAPALQKDLSRLHELRAEYDVKAQAYFKDNAEQWNDVRAMYFASEEVERALLAEVEGRNAGMLLDLGTGTGKMLELLGKHVQSAMGIDNSQQMLTIARNMLARKALTNCQVRQGDIHNVNLPDNSADIITIHHVLHYMNDPQIVLQEASRLLSKNGKLLIVDFMPHLAETFRERFAHRRLGFAPEEFKQWAKTFNLKLTEQKVLTSVDVDQQTISVQLVIMTSEQS